MAQHTAAVTDDGRLWTFGRGGGRLGHASSVSMHVPTQVRGDLAGEYVVAAACGESHTAARTRAGKLFTFGRGCDGQLGYDIAGYRRYLASATLATYCTPLCPSQRFSCLANQEAWEGGLVRSACSVQVIIVKVCVLLHRRRGEGLTSLMPGVVRGALSECRVLGVACGAAHVAAVTTDGSVFVFGAFSLFAPPPLATTCCCYPSLPLLHSTGRGGGGLSIAQLPRLTLSNCALLSHTWSSPASLITPRRGWRSRAPSGKGGGRLGLGTLESAFAPVRVEGALSGLQVRMVSCGGMHTAAVTDDGALYTW